MTDKEKIAKVAKEYSQYLEPNEKSNRTMIEVDCIGFVEWLKSEFEIVSKEKILEAYKYPQRHTEPIQGTMAEQVIGIKSVLKSLFPQTLNTK